MKLIPVPVGEFALHCEASYRTHSNVPPIKKVVNARHIWFQREVNMTVNGQYPTRDASPPERMRGTRAAGLPKHATVISLTSYRLVTYSLTNSSLYGDTTCSIIGTVTEIKDPQRKRVTGGILRSSSTRDILAG